MSSEVETDERKDDRKGVTLTRGTTQSAAEMMNTLTSMLVSTGTKSVRRRSGSSTGGPVVGGVTRMRRRRKDPDVDIDEESV